MCGICGIIRTDPANPVEREVLDRMKDRIRHRGPDDDGTHIEPGAGLGFRRLSIVDLALGHQPMCNEDETVWVVFNGEIYNHAELRVGLEAKGHVYRTRCDTETIIHLYEEEGTEAFKKFNGMFAICLWDRRLQRAVLARDRLGIKPLYYAQTPDGIAFGSEIKAVLEAPGVARELDPQAVREYLTFRFVAGQRTMFRGIQAMSPGEVLIFERGKTKRAPFWSLPEAGDSAQGDPASFKYRLGELLSESTRLRLMADVPVGSFCSGGIDSGLITAFATQHGLHGIDTFSVGFGEAEWDETRFARMVTDRYGTDHHTLTIDNATFSQSLPQMIWYHDEPLNHANSVPIHHISRLAREHVTVVLTGEGSDELFGGYPRYNVARMAERTTALPNALRQILGATALAAARILRNHRLSKLGHSLPRSLAELAIYNSAFMEPSRVSLLVAADTPPVDLSFRQQFVNQAESTGEGILPHLWRLELRTYLISLLHRMDKMTMAASIEARVPFLDHRLVEWALRLPDAVKIKGFENKHLVRRLALDYLPPEVVHRRKSGFGVPIGKWARDPKLLGRYLDLFFEDAYGSRDYMNVAGVRELIRAHIDGRQDHGETIWNLMNLELWHRIFLNGQSPSSFTV